jgi:hypothetical protein
MISKENRRIEAEASGPKVALWLAQKTGREQVGKLLGWEYLKKCSYSPQRPRPQHRKGDKIEQEEFKKNSTPQGTAKKISLTAYRGMVFRGRQAPLNLCGRLFSRDRTAQKNLCLLTKRPRSGKKYPVVIKKKGLANTTRPQSIKCYPHSIIPYWKNT